MSETITLKPKIALGIVPTHVGFVDGLVGGAAVVRDGFVAGADDHLECLSLVGGVPLDGLHKVWDEVVPALELDVDVGPTLADVLTQAHEPVVYGDEPDDRDQHECCADEHDDEPGFHGQADSPTSELTTWSGQ